MREDKVIRLIADARAYCEGKETFDRFDLAESVARRGRRNGDSSRHVYRCARCAAYHIGELVGRRTRRERLRSIAEEAT